MSEKFSSGTINSKQIIQQTRTYRSLNMMKDGWEYLVHSKQRSPINLDRDEIEC